MSEAVIGLGSNLGDRMAYLQAALDKIERFAPVVGTSRVYRTSPVGGPPQGDFLNAAVRVGCRMGAHALLARLLGVERDLGRTRDEPGAHSARWGPRVIDLDILWMTDTTIEDATLTIPHPRLVERAFALVPLLDVAPDAVDPHTHTLYRSINLASLQGELIATPLMLRATAT